MLIKSADDKEPQITSLRALLTRPDVFPETRARIEQEIRNVRAGARGEKEAAYELEFNFQSANWMILHDIRIKHQGRVAQIDHLLINRYLDIYVCESKHFAEGVGINERGEFSALYKDKPYGIPSPVEQNKKHISVLETVCKSDAVKLPARLGFKLTPSLHSLILVSKHAGISRPNHHFPWLDTILKTDQLTAYVDKDMERQHSALRLIRVVGRDTLEAFARQFTLFHQPHQFNWEAKFGLSKVPSATPILASPEPRATPDKEKSQSKYFCASCRQQVSQNRAHFCWSNKAKFAGKVFCITCQKNQPQQGR